MASVRKQDKKQNKALLGVLVVAAIGMFVRFAIQMITPSKAAAHAQTASTTRLVKTASAAAPATTDAPAPSATMRDPFAPSFADDNAIEAYKQSLSSAKPAGPVHKSGDWNHITVPPAPSMPGLQSSSDAPPPDIAPASFHKSYAAPSMPALTAAPMAPVDDTPSWMMTGVVDGDDGQVAILRNGDARRMVRQGDMVDDQFRVARVDRNDIVLSHGRHHYTIVLGAKSAPSAPVAVPQPAAVAAPIENTPQDLGAQQQPVTGLPQGLVAPGGTQIDPNAVIKLPGGLKLPTINTGSL